MSARLASSDVGVSTWDAHTLSETAVPFSLSTIQVEHRLLGPIKPFGVFPGGLIPSTGQAPPEGALHTAWSGHCHSPLTHLGESINWTALSLTASLLTVILSLLCCFFFPSLPGKFYSFYQYYQSPSNQATRDECREVWLKTTVQVSHVPFPLLGRCQSLCFTPWLEKEPRVTS